MGWMVMHQYWNNQAVVTHDLLFHKFKVRKKVRRRKKYSFKGSLHRVPLESTQTVISNHNIKYCKSIIKGSRGSPTHIDFIRQCRRVPETTHDHCEKGFKWLKICLSVFLLSRFGRVSGYFLQPNYFHTNICLDSIHDEDELGNHHALRVDSDSVPIRIDNCCTRSISYNKHDFIESTLRPVNQCYVKGFGGSITPITQKGTLAWKMMDDTGVQHEIQLPDSLLVPTSKIRLLSPQHWAQSAKSAGSDMHPVSCTTLDDRVSITWNGGKHTKTIHLDPKGSNTATLWSIPGYDAYIAYSVDHEPSCITCYPTEVQESEVSKGEQYEHESAEDIKDNHPEGPYDTISPESWELLQWHYRCGHMSMYRLQKLAAKGILPTKLARCPIPACQSCMYGKMTRQQWQTKSNTKHHIRQQVSTPGEWVSVDQLISPTPGLIAQLKGSPTRERYRVATIFVDHFTDFTYVHLQSSTTSTETLTAKHEFERYSRSCGVNIRGYHADNGRFVDNEWMRDIHKNSQGMRYAGTYAHHQNGIVEKRIRDLQDLARASLMHAMKLWPDAINATLWPYAVRKAAHDLNHIPKKDRDMSPYQLFTSSAVHDNMRTFHTFGCPTYVLHDNIKKIPLSDTIGNKWKSKARLAIYLGPSYQYARNVGLVLSLETGLVSPVFHAKYDNNFTTVIKRYGAYLPRSKWQFRCGFAKEPSTMNWVVESLDRHDNKGETHSDVIPKLVIDTQEKSSKDTEDEVLEENQINPDIDTNQDYPDSSNEEQESDDAVEQVHGDASEGDEVKRSRVGRILRKPKKLDDYVVYESELDYHWDETELDHVHPVAYAASSDPDVMYFHEILREPDKHEFLKSMQKEIDGHNENKNWVLIPRSQVPSHIKVLPSVWAMRRKRRLVDGTIYKWKARINVDGSKQTYGVDYWETYAPVAAWATIRCVMMLAAQRGWKTKQLDFVQAYPQAPAQTEMYIEVPKGCVVPGPKQDWVLRVLNNIYGQKQAGKVWNDFLILGLTTKLGFIQSKIDPSLLWRGNYIIIIYTDDTIITGPNEKEIDKIISEIGNVFKITHSETVNDFLGVKIERDERTGTVKMTQPLLIQSIINDMGFQDNSNGRNFPTLSSKILLRHKDSQDHDEKWHYRGIIGKLNYLEKSTRPDISYAVHQCARFMENPKVEHTKAVKAIVRYLIATKDKGLLCTPNDSSLECFCDADFAGNYHISEAEQETDTARSRTGYVIKYAGCPLIWASRLQTEIALSTTESEYISLSTSLRDVIPLMNLIEELRKAGFDYSPMKPRIYCKAFEDNSGALELAKAPKLRPRTKHINIKYHHFREFVKDGKVELYKIDTEEQDADILTKGLPEASFTYLRKKIMGW